MALESDGWTITHDPYTINVGDTNYHVDLGAEKLIGAEKGEEKIAVEIKSFLGPSKVNEFHIAVGQFINYSVLLGKREADRKLFLAIPDIIYHEVFQKPFVQFTLEEVKIDLLIFDPESNKIVQWIK